MNQAVHQVDAMIATAGMPSRVQARVRCARHRAEIEDDAIALLEWPSGATGVLVASLGDPAGYERMEFFGASARSCSKTATDVRVTEHEDAQKLSDECADEYPELTNDVEARSKSRARASEWIDCLIASHRDFAGAVLDARAAARRRRGGHARASSWPTRSTCRRSKTAR